MEVVASLSQGRTAAAQCGLFTHKSVPVIFEPPCTFFTVLANTSIIHCSRSYNPFAADHSKHFLQQVWFLSEVILVVYCSYCTIVHYNSYL